MAATGEPINTIAAEDGRAEGLPVVANSSENMNEEENAVDDFNFVASIRASYVDDDVDFTDADLDVGILPDIGDITADDLLQGVFSHVSDGYAQPDGDATATLIGGIGRTEAEGDVVTTTGPSPTIDATTQTGVAVVDASTSSNDPRRHVNEVTQTHRDGHQFLPDGITLKQLAQRLFESPKISVADMAYALGRELPTTSALSGSLDTIETVLYGMDTMARTIIGFLADQKQEGHTSTEAADRARLVVLQKLGALWNRSTEFHPPSAGRDVPSSQVEEIPRSPSTNCDDVPASPSEGGSDTSNDL